MKRKGCQARQVSDQMSCHKCGLVWDINDPEPPQCLTNHQREIRKMYQILNHSTYGKIVK